MPYSVTLETPNRIHEFTVKTAQFGENDIRFTGFDPSQCPEELENAFRFASNNLTAILLDESIIESLDVRPTEDRVPDGDPAF